MIFKWVSFSTCRRAAFLSLSVLILPAQVVQAQLIEAPAPNPQRELNPAVAADLDACPVILDGGPVDVTLRGPLELEEGFGIFSGAIPIAQDGFDAGCLGQPGEWSASHYDGVYTLADSWGDIWQEGDTFSYAFSKVRGDFVLSAHIVERNPHPNCEWGRNSVMIREDLTPDSRMAYTIEPLWGRSTVRGGDWLYFGWRSEHGIAAAHEQWVDVGFGVDRGLQQRHDWIRIERSGDTMTGYYSDDGVEWTSLASVVWQSPPQDVYTGLALSGRNGPAANSDDFNCAAPPSSVTYDNVELVLAGGAEILPVDIVSDMHDPAEAVTVVEQVLGDGIDSSSVAAGDGVEVRDIPGGPPPKDVEPVGIFQDAIPIATQFWGAVEPGCIGGPGEWFATHDAGTGQYTLADSWGDIWQEGDTFSYAYSKVRGDFVLSAHIFQRDPHPDCFYGRNVVMIRQDLTPNSRYNWTGEYLWGGPPNGEPPNEADILTRFGYRPTHGGNDDTLCCLGGPNDWIRIARRGNTMEGFTSINGIDWGMVSSSTWENAPEVVYAGLAVSGRNGPTPNSSTVNCDDPPSAVTYDNVQLVLANGSGIVPLGERDILGAEMTWNTTRGQLAEGLDYRVDVEEADLTFEGRVEALATHRIGGSPSISLVQGGVGPECPAERTITADGRDCPGSAPVTVDVRYPVQGRNPDEVVTVTERVSGPVEPEQVTATAGGEVLPGGGGFGVDVRWNVSRAQLEDGVGYSMDVPEGEFQFSGDADGANIAGPSTKEIASCPPERTIAPCQGETRGSISVTVQQPLGGRDPDELVRVREEIIGDVVVEDVTATNGGVVSEKLSGFGIFSEALPIAVEPNEPGCIDEPGQWVAGYDDGIGQYTLGDSWGDIWQEGDTFTFAYSEVRGDFLLTARTVERNPHPGCIFGRNSLMIRQDLTTGSRLNYITDQLFGTSNNPPDTATRWGFRSNHGGVPGDDQWLTVSGQRFDWYQIERVGDTMSGYYSEDGITWERLDFSTWLNPPETVFTGLAVSGRNGPTPNSSAVNCDDPPSTVTFDEVELLLGAGAEVVSDGKKGLSGVDVTWEVPRSALEAGLGYEIAGDEEEPVELLGNSAGEGTVGPRNALVCGSGGGRQFRRGDVNEDGGTNLADAVATFNFLFLGGDEPPCLDAADTNDADDALNLTDGVYLLNFLFLGGDAPPAPGPFDCGPEGDGSPISFGCDEYDACGVGE